MYGILLTQNSTFLFRYIVWILGKIMEGIFYVLDLIGIPNVGLSIILFTIFVNIAMLPLTYKQQKFSKLSMKMNPEIKAIQKKYEGKKDSDSAYKQNAEVQAVYAKYGVSQTGGCLYLLIQLPIMIALYRVIYAMPAYVGKIRAAFFPLVDKLVANEEVVELIKGFKTSAMFAKQFGNEKFELTNTLIDCLNRASTADFQSISDSFPEFASDVTNTVNSLSVYNNFLGLNTGNNPWFIITEALESHTYLLVVGALLIPLLAGATQWISLKLAPQQQPTGDAQTDNMTQSMKSMNNFMPLMSIWFCFTLPAGMGIYWIASAVVRCTIQIIMNKKIDKMDMDAVIAANVEKSKKKIAKLEERQEKMSAYANMNTRNIPNTQQRSMASKTSTGNASNASSAPSPEARKASPGSMLEKANMVRDFNERNTKK